MDYTSQTLAHFCSSVSTDDVPEQVLDAAERALLDTIAAIIGGAGTKNAHCIRSAGFNIFGEGAFKAWFCDSDPMHFLGALLANCAAASALDIDDGHRGAAGHPGAAIIPAVLMQCQKAPPLPGRDILAAIAIGYDVALRIGQSRHRHDQISYASGIWTCYGVAAALGRLNGLSDSSLAHAIAIAGAEAPQNLPQGACLASSVKGSSPWSTVTAAVAVARAAAGASGSIDLLDRPTAYDIAAICQDLSVRWLITETYQKPYASCRYTHPVIDAILQLRPAAGWNISQIQSITVEIFPEAEKLPNNVAPTSLEDAQFSIPFAAALAIVTGASGFRPLQPDSLEDSRILGLAQKICLDYSSTDFHNVFPARTPARVTLVIDGKHQSVQVDYPVGDVANPMSTEAIASKLADLDCQTSSRTGDLLAAVKNLRRSDSKQLLDLLV
jgi:2-methylcitrate dehydratase PrpD